MDVAIIIASGIAAGFALTLLAAMIKSTYSMTNTTGNVGNSRVVDHVEDTAVGVEEVKSGESTFSVSNVGENMDSVDIKILELRKKGLSVRKIAKEVGLSPSTVYRRLRKLKASGKST